MKPIKITSLDSDDLLKIRWCVGNVCNFKCAYCESNKGDYAYPKNVGMIHNNFYKLLETYSKQGKKRFELELSGGEPTLWPELGMFVTTINKLYDIDMKLITNGSRTLRWWNKYAKQFSKVVFSFHHKQADIDHFINVVDLVVSKGVDVHCLVLMDPNEFDKCVDSINYMKKNRKRKWFIESRPVFPIETFPVTYTEEQKKYMKNDLKALPGIGWFLKNWKNLKPYGSVVEFENGKTKKVNYTYHNLNYNTFKGWKCDIEKENIYIHWDGVLQGSCGQGLFDKPYNIYDTNFIKEFNPVVKTLTCQRDCCWCQPETHISKSLS